MTDILFSNSSVTGRRDWHDGADPSVQKTIQPQVKPFDEWYTRLVGNESSASSSVMEMDKLIGRYTFDLSLLQKRAIESEATIAEEEEFIEDYSYLIEASQKAVYAKPIKVNREDLHAYQGLSDYTYTLDVDYDEE